MHRSERPSGRDARKARRRIYIFLNINNLKSSKKLLAAGFSG
jgi:hypothetical protein